MMELTSEERDRVLDDLQAMGIPPERDAPHLFEALSTVKHNADHFFRWTRGEIVATLGNNGLEWIERTSNYPLAPDESNDDVLADFQTFLNTVKSTDFEDGLPHLSGDDLSRILLDVVSHRRRLSAKRLIAIGVQITKELEFMMIDAGIWEGWSRGKLVMSWVDDDLSITLRQGKDT